MSHQPAPLILPGDYLHPLGTAYTLEVVRVIPPAPGEPGQIQCRRWGLDQANQPKDDGNGHGMRYLHTLSHAGGPRWEDPDPAPWACHPWQYVHTPGAGQLALF